MNFATKLFLFLGLTATLQAENSELLNLSPNPIQASITTNGQTRKIEISPRESSGRFHLAQGSLKVGDLSHHGKKEGQSILIYQVTETPSLKSFTAIPSGENFIQLAILNLTTDAITLEIVNEKITAEPGQTTTLGDFKKSPNLNIPGIGQRQLPRLKPQEKCGITLLLFKEAEKLQIRPIYVYGN